jgi:1,4-dihydroxy-2-naphthoate octaprenyltransferase
MVIFAFVSWLLLVGGLTVLNSYYDKDEAPVGGMAHPPEVAVSLLYGALIMLATAIIMTFFVSYTFFYLALMVAILYFFYSYDRTRWKANGYVAVAINATVGALTVLAAASLGGSLTEPAVILAAITAAFFKASVYTMMQVHQIEEDTLRGDVSVAVMYGRERTLRFSQVTFLIGGLFAVLALYMIGAGLVIPILGGIYFLATTWLFERWIQQPGGPEQDAAYMQRMVAFTGYAGSLTFFVLYLVLGWQGII